MKEQDITKEELKKVTRILTGDLERIVEFTPAFDKRDPDPKKNYGIHGVELRMVLKGNLGAVQFVLYTQWHLPKVTDELWENARASMKSLFTPMPADLGYHSPVAQYKEQKILKKECEYLDGKPCYYDGSGLNAQRIYDILLTRGSDGVWEELTNYYHQTFGRIE